MNKQPLHRLLALFLALVMVIGYIPTYTFATETEQTQETTAAFAEETEAATEAEETETATEAATEEATEASEAATEEATEAATEEATEETTQPAEEQEYNFPDVDSMTDAELLAYYAGLTDEEAEAFALSLTAKQLERLSDLLYAVELCGESSETHTVFKNTQSTLAPGVTQNLKFAYAKDGKQMAYYIATADVTRDDVVVQTSYYKQHENGVMGMAKLTDQIAYANAKYTNPADPLYISDYYNVVAGANASFYNMSTGQPIGITYIDGVSFGTNSYDNFFAILKDGKTAVIDYAYNLGKYVDENGNSTIWQASAGSGWLVRDGKDVTANASGSYNTDRHSRTCVGITADGKVVIMTLDGRQEPYSCGGTFHELAQIMLEAGCVAAVNLDGGGSSTFVSKAAGSDSISVVNRPSDGSVRSISSGIIIASTAAPSNVFATAVLTAEEEYVTPKSTVNVTAVGVSPAGTSAAIPADAIWQLADSTMGTVENGVFTASEKTGDAVVQMVSGGKVVGETTIHVVIPDLAFATPTMVVPNSKTFDLEVIGTTNDGMNTVKLKDEDLVFTLSNPAMGTIEGKTYTSCDEDAGIEGGTITVTCVYDETKTATAQVTFGKASVIAKDFEDKDITGWSGKSAYTGRNHPVYGRFEKCSLAVVSESTGKVRNGDYALAITADFTDTTASGYKAVKFTFPAIDLTDATAFGMWMYLPVRDLHNLEFDIGGYEFYPEDFDTYNEDGWYYISASTELVGSSISSFAIYLTDPDESYFNVFNKFTIYVDDLTLDYSAATEDREIPLFTDVSVSAGTDSLEPMNGQVIHSNSFVVKATAQDDPTGNSTGLEVESAKVYVNGRQLAAGTYTCDESGVISADISMGNGTHTFRFEIADNNGNVGFVTRQVVVNTQEAEVTVMRRASDKVQPLAGSIVWFDVVAQNAENVQSISLKMDLDALNSWELQGAQAVYGYDISTGKDYLTNTAYVNLTRTENATATGETVLASVPVRVWQTNAYLNQTYIDAGVVVAGEESSTVGTPSVMWATDRTRLVRVELNVESIQVTHTGGNYSTYSQKQINVITELNRYRSAGYYTESGSFVTGDTTFVMQGKTSTHTHTETAMADKAATCTEHGYTGRTHCEICDSVLTWGTAAPATGHSYAIVDGVLKCHCGATFTGTWTDGKEYTDGIAQADGWVGDSYYAEGAKLTGIHQVPAPDGSGEFYYDFGEDGVCANRIKYTGLVHGENGKTYYSKLGELAASWYCVDDVWYYFSHSDYAAVTGEYNYYGIIYTFDDQGKLIAGAWVESENGTRYYYCSNKYYHFTWETIDGNTYFFDRNGYRTEGIAYFRDSTGGTKLWYEFTEDGVFVRMLDGIVEIDGVQKYFKEGILQSCGLVELDGKVYYVRSSGEIVTGKYYVNKYSTEELKSRYPEGTYYFDEDGVMVGTGFVTMDGTKYYVENGAITAAGFVEVDGAYYYARSGGVVATGKYYATHCRTEELKAKFPAGYYYFDGDGKLVSTGFIVLDGQKYYVENGAITSAGFVEVDGAYYYVRSGGLVVTGKYYATRCRTEELKNQFPERYYYFAEDGKLIRNGFYTDNGVTYYIDKDVITAAGLVEFNGQYYYVRSGGIVVTGNYYITRHSNAELKAKFPQGSYYFDDTGAMIINGFVSLENTTYYVKDGKIKAAGLVEVDGKLYYARSGGSIVTGKYYVTSHSTTELAEAYPEAYYYFDETGAMIVSGFITQNGDTYYVCNGRITSAGLIEVDGAVYYAKSGGKIVTGKYYVNKYSTKALAQKYPPAYYTFDANGKMI